MSDTDILKWANSTVQKVKPSARPIRSFKDSSLTTGIFFLDLLEALRPGIVDPTLINNVSDSGDYEQRRQNGESDYSLKSLSLISRHDIMGWGGEGCYCCVVTEILTIVIVAKLAISIARKLNALIFLVPEDIVDVRPRLVSFFCFHLFFHPARMYSDIVTPRS